MREGGMSGLVIIAACVAILWISISMEENAIRNEDPKWRRIAMWIQHAALVGVAVGLVVVAINDLVHLF